MWDEHDDDDSAWAHQDDCDRREQEEAMAELSVIAAVWTLQDYLTSKGMSPEEAEQRLHRALAA